MKDKMKDVENMIKDMKATIKDMKNIEDTKDMGKINNCQNDY